MVTKLQNERHRKLRDRVRAIHGDVGNDDTMIRRGDSVDAVPTGRGDRDEFHAGQARKEVASQQDLVDDNDGRVRATLQNFFRR